MKALIQRVSEASVTVEGKLKGSCKKGFLILFCSVESDDKTDIPLLAGKVSKLRIFEDENGKMNLNINDVGGKILTVSQFTLYADCRKGTRPGFSETAEPGFANEMYEYFLSLCMEKLGSAEHGRFGADMQVELLNDGPVTIFLEFD